MTRYYTALISLLVIVIMTDCAVHGESAGNYHFEWDISAENHTGIPKDYYAVDRKHRGMSVFHWSHQDLDESANQIIKNNIEWVAVIPFLYQETDTTKILRPQGAEGIWTQRDSMHILAMRKLHERQVHTMLKPHIWMSKGWRSNIGMNSDEEWNTWFDSYEAQMIHFAMLAEHVGTELFCIGTEMKSSIISAPERWDQLITKIKTVYSGKLTYAANWDGEFNNIKFWDRMDYIGIQAYFPLTNNVSPTLAEIEDGWNTHIKTLKKLSKKYGKPILFTETGYRSDVAATIKPWEWGNSEDTKANLPCKLTQNLAYEALFRKLWHQDWFAGVYFWQWHNSSKEGEDYNLTEFTPRYKPAENTMAKWYGKKDDLNVIR